MVLCLKEGGVCMNKYLLLLSAMYGMAICGMELELEKNAEQRGSMGSMIAQPDTDQAHSQISSDDGSLESLKNSIGTVVSKLNSLIIVQQQANATSANQLRIDNERLQIQKAMLRLQKKRT